MWPKLVWDWVLVEVTASFASSGAVEAVLVEMFFVVEAGLESVDKKIHGDVFAIGGSQKVHQPGFDSTAIHLADGV